MASAASSPGATSAERFAASATRYQNSTITKAMARVRGGTRVSANEVEWRHGGMILRVPTSPRARVSTSADHVSTDQSFANYESHTTGYAYCETPRYGNNSPSFSSDFTGSVSVTAQAVWMSNNSARC